jgi:hypothetical protein
MHFLTDPLVELALNIFNNLDLKQGDWFFSTFGPGNLINATDRPHERFNKESVGSGLRYCNLGEWRGQILYVSN